MIALQEMLLQTPGDRILLLPAWPKDWNVDFKLHAPAQTVVLCHFEDGEVLTTCVVPSGRAGHIGHISLDPDGAADIVGTPGSLEDAIGECSIAKRTDGRFHCTKDLLAAVYSGETAAKQFWDKSIQALAAAIVSFINTLDPEIIVIGGGVAQAGDALFAPLRERVAAMEWKPVGRSVPIMPTSLGELGGTSGAAFAALSQFQENPSPPE